MKTTATLYVYKAKYAEGVEVKSFDSTKWDHGRDEILLDTVDVEVEYTMPSDREILEKVVAGLKAAKAQIEAKAYIEAKAIQDKIDSLLCLEYTPEVEA